MKLPPNWSWETLNSTYVRESGMESKPYVRRRFGTKNYEERSRLEMATCFTVSPVTGCWEFKGKKNRDGYGSFRYKNSNNLAHRASWIMFKGEIPNNMCVCHSCDNPSCLNPEHLFLGTHKENMQDSARKGRRKGKPANNRKFSSVQIVEIISAYKSGHSTTEIAKLLNCHRNTIWNLVTNRTYSMP